MKVTIREALLLFAVVATGLGWWVDRRRNYPAPEFLKWGEHVLRTDLDIAEVDIKGPYHEFYVNGTMVRQPIAGSFRSLPAMPDGRQP